MSFINKNYQDKVTLEQIANAGGVCKSSCCNIFKKYLHDSPMNYMINYRIECSAKKLKETDLTITEIAFEVGFSGASYYSEMFHKYFGCSPKEYRMRDL